MDFEKFKEWAVEDITSRLPEGYEDAELRFEEVKKFGGNYTGLSLRKPGSDISPTVNMEQFYGFYLNGVEMEQLGCVMADMLQYHVDQNDIDMEWIADYETAREHFFLCLSNAENNPGYLNEAPHELKADLALTCHIMSEIPGEGYVGTLVNGSLMEEYSVDEDKLFKDAFENSMKIMPVRTEFARDVCGGESSRDKDDPFYSMMIISNERHFRGAAALFYPGVMETVALKLGGSFYVLPSSVHEVLAIPADPSLNVTDLQQLVMEANLLHVPMDERLSDNVYYYDVCTGEFMKAEPECVQ